MIIHTPSRYESVNALANRASDDAERACRAFREDVWLVCRNAPKRVRERGDAAATAFERALHASQRDPETAVWRDFVASVWQLLAELDRYPSQASWRWRQARGALARVIVDNVDLLEVRALAKDDGVLHA